MLDNLILFYITLIVVFEAVAQSCLKTYSNTNNYNYFFVGIVSYAIVSWLLCQSYNHKGGMGLVNLIWSALSIITSTIIGIMMFKEQFHAHDIIATLLITAGIMILRFTQ